MTDRFEIVSEQMLQDSSKFCHNYMVVRDKLTGIMYLDTGEGITPLLNKDGAPMTAFKVNI